MKLATAQTGTETFNIGMTKKAQISLREEDLRKVKKIMRDKLYTYKSLAPVRELFCNALDIHNQTGATERIEIQAPTSSNPVFRIRDYGTGLTEQGVEFYCTYLASDKDGDDDQVGGFGLGSKSPMAYCDQYVLKSYVDGRCWVYSVFIDEQDDIAFVLLSADETDEPNGLEIEIPVANNDCYQFGQNIRQVVQFTPRERIKLINTDYPREIRYIIETDEYGVSHHASPIADFQCGALVGPIRYPIPDEVLTKAGFESHQLKGVILKFKIGEVQLSPTREALSLDPQTEEVIINRLKKVKDDAQARVDDVVSKETCQWHRIRRFYQLRSSHRIYGSVKSALVDSDEIAIEPGDLATRVMYKGERDGPAKFWKSTSSTKRPFYPLKDTIILQDTTSRVLARITNNQWRIGQVVGNRNGGNGDVWLVSEAAIKRLGIEPDFILSELAPPAVDRKKRGGRRVYEYAGWSSNRASSWKAVSSDDLPDEYYYVVMNGTEPQLEGLSFLNLRDFVSGNRSISVYGIPKSNLDLVEDDSDAIDLIAAGREKLEKLTSQVGDVTTAGIARKRRDMVNEECWALDVICKVDPRLEALVAEMHEQCSSGTAYYEAERANLAFPGSFDLGKTTKIDLEKDPLVRGFKALTEKNPVLRMMYSAQLFRNREASAKILKELEASIKLPTTREFKSGKIKSNDPTAETQQDAA